MTLRMRLALYCTVLCGFVLLLVGTLSYALYVRSQYDTLDRALVTSVGHAVLEAPAMADSPHLVWPGGGFDVALRLYRADGTLLESMPSTGALPLTNPRAVLTSTTPPPYDALASLASPLLNVTAAAPGGAFALLTLPSARWRVYVEPVHLNGHVIGYVEGVTSLARLDSSISMFRFMLLTLSLFGLVIALFSARAVAARVLRPIAMMTATAQAIAASHDLTRRIAPPAHHDELGRMATTFNAMLEGIESAYHTQQRFVADASHELRAPLTAIQGNIDLLRHRPDMLAADRNEALAEVEHEAMRLSRLVGDLLALARADAGITLQQRPVELDAVVLEAFQTARPLAADHTLTLDPFEPLQVRGDTDRLKQLILILLDNALKYTPPGGSVRLSLRRDGTSAEVRVIDNGIGISGTDLPHVFERFYRADPARTRDSGGSGLGLAIAGWIVAQHAGTISLESQPECGTIAVVRLPLLA